jgi:hypothetical protein
MHHLHVKLPQFAKSARSSWLIYPTKTTFTKKKKIVHIKFLSGLLLILYLL